MDTTLKPTFLSTCLSLAASITILFSPAWGQYSDSFEGGEPRFLLVESDCRAQLTEQGISLLMPHGGRTCEMFEVACSHGTMVLMAYPIEPCAILDEFQPEFWVRCSSGRLQIGVRVIFPFAAHPVTGGRLSTIVWGDLYQQTGDWQKLQLLELESKLRNETVSLHQRHGSDLNLDGAYIDSIVLNAYTGPGRYRVQVDDLNLRGIIPMASVGQAPPPDWRAKWQWRYEVPTPQDHFWSAPNRPAVWLQRHDESAAWISSLGFTGVLMQSVPSAEQLGQLQAQQLALLSPPPEYPLQYPAELLPTIRGWMAGAAMDRSQTSVAKTVAAQVASFPKELQRPIVVEALEDFFAFSRVSNETVVPVPIAESAGSASDKRDWLAGVMTDIGQRGQGWVSIPVGLTPGLAEQIDVARESLFGDEGPPIGRTNPMQIRHQTVAAALAGARGFLFRTFKPLSLNSPDESAQVAALRWINSDLRLWGPWLVAGQSSSQPVVNDPRWAARTWTIDSSHLILAQFNNSSGFADLAAPGNAELELGIAQAANGQQVFRLTRGVMDRVDATPSPAGSHWRIENPRSIETFLITSDPRVIRFVRQHLADSAARNAADQLEISNYYLSIAQTIAFSRYAPESGSAQVELPLPAISEASRRLERGWQALRTEQPAAASGLSAASMELIASVITDAQREAASSLSTIQSSPFVVTPTALPLHWSLARACERSEWNAVGLPGGELTQLDAMLDAGWSQQRREDETAELRIELIPAAEQRPNGIRLAAYARDPETHPLTGGYEGASIRIRSAGTPVRRGQLVRVAALARILHCDRQPNSGLLVYDNQAGPSMGQLVRGQPGDTVPIELYRFVTHDGDFRLLSECRGSCDIILDSLRLDLIRPATDRATFITTPLVPELFQPTMVVPSP